MYKIFINEKPFLISNRIPDEKKYARCKTANYDPHQLLDHIKYCESMSGKGMILLADDEEMAFKDFTTHFVSITAAGGVVKNNVSKLLLIKRMGKWDLPKGKIDGDETPAEAAIREVEEECGINQLQIVSEPITTYHTYKMHNHRFLKITYWFKMTTTFSGNLIPQTEEQITEVKWENMSSKLLEELDTYESIKDLLVTVV